MRVNRVLHVFLILVIAASQLAAAVHAVEHVTLHFHGAQTHSHDGLPHHGTAQEPGHSHDHNHEHAHSLINTPAAPDTGKAIEPDCLAFHVYLSLCAMAASQSETLAPPLQAVSVARLATPPTPIGRITHQSIRGPPALS